MRKHVQLTTLFLPKLFVVVLVAFATLSWAQEIDPNLYKQLQYRFIGPDGNRTIAVVGEPSNNNVIYVGAASGGIFKTIDGGINWEPIFDDQKVSSIGSLAIAPSDTNVVWAGTGETFIIRPALSVGDGIYKSTDAGKTWKRMGLDKTGRIGRIVVDPRDSNVVLACAVGHAYAPQPERGVFRTSDGGETWEKVLFVDENTGCSDLAMDPNNPRHLVAGMWQIQIDTWGLNSGGPGSGVHVSRDNGKTWEQVSGRYPEKVRGCRVGKAIPSERSRWRSRKAIRIVSTPWWKTRVPRFTVPTMEE
jgi:photosystem II stability/assembly factor-like uncharacterized protein